MSVLVDKNTRLVVQGITGSAGAFHTRQCMDYGTNVVAGVTPGKGGQMFDSKVPVFDTVWEARQKTGCNASMVFVPAPAAADSILEAVDAGVELVVCITEGIPVMDMMRAKVLMRGKQSRLIGPNCPGIITPGACKIGIMPGYIHKPGNIGVISRSGTLTYEAVWQLTSRGYGQSTCIGIDGDPIHGLSHLDCVKLFNEDPGTDAMILIGEIGGSAEEEAAAWLRQNIKAEDSLAKVATACLTVWQALMDNKPFAEFTTSYADAIKESKEIFTHEATIQCVQLYGCACGGGLSGQHLIFPGRARTKKCNRNAFYPRNHNPGSARHEGSSLAQREQSDAGTQTKRSSAHQQ